MIGNVPMKYGKKQAIKEKKDRMIQFFSERNGTCDEYENQERKFSNETFRRKNYQISFRKAYKGPILPLIVKPKPEFKKSKQNSNMKVEKDTKSLAENNTKKMTQKQPTPEPETEPIRKPSIFKEEPQYSTTPVPRNSIRKEDILQGLSSQRKPSGMKDDPLFFDAKDSAKLGFREKILVSFRGSKILNVRIEGHLVWSGSQNIKEVLLTLNPFWFDPQKIKYQVCKNDLINITKRGEESLKSFLKIYEKSFKSKQTRVSFGFQKNQSEASLINYILNPDQFKFSQIPILFIYKYEKSPTDPLITILNITFRVIY